jgi:hypothetical protein
MSVYVEVKKVLTKKQKGLLRKKGIVATGIGYKVIDGKLTDELSIVCSVDKKQPLVKIAKQDLVPPVINGIVTDVVETGVIKALHTEKHRPTICGTSVGHVDITCGTLGAIVKKEGIRYILSNNHVLAMSNDAKIGDPILQPGSYDNGIYPDDHIANLSDFKPINFTGVSSGCSISNGFTTVINGILSMIGSKTRLQSIQQAETNLIDAAIAKPLEDKNVSDEIMKIGKIAGVENSTLGMKIQKSGRTTGVTTGEIIQMDVTVNVQYGEGKIATFTDQFMAGKMCEGGDSGSAVLDMNNNIVGLLFGGSDNSMVASKIDNVFDILNIHL